VTEGPLRFPRRCESWIGVSSTAEKCQDDTLISKSAPRNQPDQYRDLYAAFAGLTIPIVGHSSFTASGRFDHYGDFAASCRRLRPDAGSDPSSPYPRSWQNSSAPPTSRSSSRTRISARSWRSGCAVSSGTTAALIESGKNSQLKQERSTNWSVDIEYKPPARQTPGRA